MNIDLLCSFDLETTGVDPLTDRIVTSACVDIDVTNGNSNLHEWLADPGIDIPTGASDVHGITTDYAREHGRDHDTVLGEIIDHIYSAWDAGASLVVYNASFDLTMLYALSKGAFQIRGPVIDPLVLDKKFDTYRKGNRKLVTVAGHYGIHLSEDDAHAADADALAAARIVWKMANVHHASKFPRDVQALMQLQEKAKMKQFNSLKSYFERQGKTIDGDGGWPIQHAALQAFPPVTS